jgi:hypothetical protein
MSRQFVQIMSTRLTRMFKTAVPIINQPWYPFSSSDIPTFYKLVMFKQQR